MSELDFPRTLRLLVRDGFGLRAWAPGLVGFALLTSWVLWLGFAKVTVRAVSTNARLEVVQAPHRVEARVAGLITAVHARLGLSVRAGDVLVELERKDLVLQLDELKARAASLRSRAAKLRSVIAAEERAGQAATNEAGVSISEAREQLRAATVEARVAREEAGRAAGLREKNLVSEAELARARATAEFQESQLAARQLAVQQRELQQRAGELRRQAEVERSGAEPGVLEQQAAEADSTILRLSHQLEQRLLRAPVDGVVGELAALLPGSVLPEGANVASIVPVGDVRVVADYAPREALGRVKPGQHAVVRLDGFAWLQYGALLATVDQVGSQPRDGVVRVELSLDPASAPGIPRENGVTGQVEIALEETSPAIVLLRSVGAATGAAR